MNTWEIFSLIRSRLVAGFLTLLPIILTIWVIAAIVRFADSMLQPFLVWSIGREVPGVGLFLSLAILYVVGFFIHVNLLAKFVEIAEGYINKIPIAGTLYSSLRQTVQTIQMSSSMKKKYSRIVFTEYPKTGSWVVAFVTNEIVNKERETFFSVFVPTTPNPTSGFLLVVKESDVINTNFTVDDAVKFVMSAGMLLPENKEEIARIFSLQSKS